MSSFTVEQAPPVERVRIIYNMYNDSFPLINGILNANEIDEEYCLSDVMPGCSIQLSKTTPAEYTKLAQRDPNVQIKYEKQEPRGTFINLLPQKDYYVWVTQNEEELEIDKSMLETQCQKLEERIVETGSKNFIQPNNNNENRNDSLLDEIQGFDEQYTEFSDLKDTWGAETEEVDATPAFEQDPNQTPLSKETAEVSGGWK